MSCHANFCINTEILNSTWILRKPYFVYLFIFVSTWGFGEVGAHKTFSAKVSGALKKTGKRWSEVKWHVSKPFGLLQLPLVSRDCSPLLVKERRACSKKFRVICDTNCFFWSFYAYRPKWFRNRRKNWGDFGQNVWKCRLKNTVNASFNTTVREMTEMFQWPKFLNKTDRNVSAKRKNMTQVMCKT